MRSTRATVFLSGMTQKCLCSGSDNGSKRRWRSLNHYRHAKIRPPLNFGSVQFSWRTDSSEKPGKLKQNELFSLAQSSSIS